MLHPTHHLMLDLKYPLVHLYNTSEPLPVPLLDRKVTLCRQILSVADVLTPGERWEQDVTETERLLSRPVGTILGPRCVSVIHCFFLK